MYLPGFLYRCRDTGETPSSAGSTAAGEINCGDSVCGSGEKCCYALSAGAGIGDGVAHCAPVADPCTCSASSDGDAG